LHGAGNGECGRNRLNQHLIRAKQNFSLQAGDVLTIETAGGGGWGKPDDHDC
jgi:N-methylhydantoinase B/oxoprolinase/acetone carboxylase alpha subunit